MAVTQNDETSTRSPDELLGVLEDEHRRTVVEVLAEEGRPIGLSLLAESVVAEMRDASVDAPTPGDVERVKVELHHHHLPKLDAAGVLDYDYEESRAVPAESIHTARGVVKSVTA